MVKAMPKKSSTVERPEPRAEMVLDFVDRRDLARQKWAESGADWAYFIVRFLQGQRRVEVHPEEITGTLLYQRSNDAEKQALRLVCEEPVKGIFPSWEDQRLLRERDHWLNEFIEGRNLGHGDLVKQLSEIPSQVAAREDWDRTYFHEVYPSRKLFSWLWGGKS